MAGLEILNCTIHRGGTLLGGTPIGPEDSPPAAENGKHSSCDVIAWEHNGQTVAARIGAGSRDQVTVYADRDPDTPSVLVLAENSPLGYIGLEILDMGDGELLGSAFLQGDEADPVWDLGTDEERIDYLADYVSGPYY